MITYNGYWFLWNIIGASQGSGAYQQLLSENGYTKFPNGLIIQWGVLQDVSLIQVWHTVNFPIEFPHAAFSVQAVSAGNPTKNGGLGFSSTAGDTLCSYHSLTTKSMVVGYDYDGEGRYAINNGDIYWIAIGY